MDHTEKKNGRFIIAMERLRKEQTAAATRFFLDALTQDAEFYMPMKTAGIGRERKPAFAVLNDGEKHHYYAIFTSKKRAEHWNAEEKSYAVLDFRQLAGMSLGDERISGFVIDAGTEDMILGRKLIMDALRVKRARELGEEAVEVEGEIRFREPTGDYWEMLDALREYMSQDPNVSAAYLQEAELNGELCYVIIVNHIGQIQPSFANISLLAKDFGNGRPVALLSARLDQAEKAIASLLPFYRKAIHR